MPQALTHQMISREAAKMLTEMCPFVGNINRAREDEFATPAYGGYKLGDNINIKVPPSFQVFDGPNFAGGGSVPAANETQVNLKLDTYKHIPLQFTSREKALQLSEFKDRFLKPAMQTLASSVNAIFLAKAKSMTPGVVGAAGTLPADFGVLAAAKSYLDRNLAPVAQRYGCISSDSNASLTNKTINLFNPQGVIDRQFKSGILGDNNGIEWYTDQGLPVHTNGSKVAGVTVSGASQSGTSLTVGGLTYGDTIKAGSVFTIAGVYECHPIVGPSMPYIQLRQFTVTSDFTATGATGALSISPAINIDSTQGPYTVTALPANGAAMTFVGAAATSYRQNLVFQKDAFSAAFVPVPVLASCEGYTATLPNGVSVRVMTFGNGQTDVENTRIDVLCGMTAVRPTHAVRITE